VTIDTNLDPEGRQFEANFQTWSEQLLNGGY
jgi:hypothetical protein